MAWPWEFNFSQTDTGDNPSTSTYVIGDAYPTTRTINGVSVTFGWEDSIDSRNRAGGIDIRLDGINFPTGNQAKFRVDLPSPGTYEIRIANGDQGSSQGAQHVEFRDNASTLVTLDDAGGTGASHYNDATGVDRTETTWPGSNAASTQVFSSSIFRLVMGNAGGGGGAHVIAHLSLNQIAAASGQLPRPTIVSQSIKRSSYW